MTKLNGFWTEIIHICCVYTYNNKKKIAFVFHSYIWGGGGGALIIYFFVFKKKIRCFILKIYHLRY